MDKISRASQRPAPPTETREEKLPTTQPESFRESMREKSSAHTEKSVGHDASRHIRSRFVNMALGGGKNARPANTQLPSMSPPPPDTGGRANPISTQSRSSSERTATAGTKEQVHKSPAEPVRPTSGGTIHAQAASTTRPAPPSISTSLSTTTTPVASATARAPQASAGTTGNNGISKFIPPNKAPFSQIIQNRFLASLRPEALALMQKHGLTETEAVAIHAYTKEKYFENMNTALRSVNKDGQTDVSNPAALQAAGIDDELALMIASTITGMRKLPPTQTSDTHFDSVGRNDSVPEEFLNAYREGTTVAISAFYSTTVSMETVEDWWDMKDHGIFIFQRANGNGRDISAFSEFEREKEILFMPGTKFMVLARTEKTITPSGKVKSNPTATKEKILMHLQEVSSSDELPPSIHPLTFGEKTSLRSPEAAPPSTPAVSNKPSPKTAGQADKERKGAYFGLR